MKMWRMAYGSRPPVDSVVQERGTAVPNPAITIYKCLKTTTLSECGLWPPHQPTYCSIQQCTVFHNNPVDQAARIHFPVAQCDNLG
ncbi:unnamed protein product [Gadus morhua 'NCC']